MTLYILDFSWQMLSYLGIQLEVEIQVIPQSVQPSPPLHISSKAGQIRCDQIQEISNRYTLSNRPHTGLQGGVYSDHLAPRLP